MTMNIGVTLDKMHRIREKRRKLSEEDKELKTQYDAFEAQLIAEMEANGLDSARGKQSVGSVQTSFVYALDDFDAFVSFVKRGNKFHLLQRRLSSTAVAEELVNRKQKPIPGVNVLPRKSILLRTRNT